MNIQGSDPYNPLYSLPLILFLFVRLIDSLYKAWPAMDVWQVLKLLGAIALVGYAILILRRKRPRFTLTFAPEALVLTGKKGSTEYPLAKIHKLVFADKRLIAKTRGFMSPNLSLLMDKDTYPQDKAIAERWAREHNIPCELG